MQITQVNLYICKTLSCIRYVRFSTSDEEITDMYSGLMEVLKQAIRCPKSCAEIHSRITHIYRDPSLESQVCEVLNDLGQSFHSRHVLCRSL